MAIRKQVSINKEPLADIKTLADLVGPSEASRLMGLSKSAVSEMISAGECRPVYNLAARLLLQERNKRDAGNLLYFVRVPRSDKGTFERVVGGLGYKFRTFSED